MNFAQQRIARHLRWVQLNDCGNSGWTAVQPGKDRLETPTEFRFGPFRLNRSNQSLHNGDQDVPLTPKAFAVLLHIADRSGSLVTKRELLDAVWGDVHVTDGALKRCVVEIRKALGDSAEEPCYIQTLHGRGYRFLPAHAPPAKASHAPIGQTTMVVGRQLEFEVLDDSFDKTLRGVRQIVFVTGEAGLGKTTLVDNWLRSLSSRDLPAGSAIGRGRCLQQFGSGEPYLPVFESLEHLSRSVGSKLVPILRRYSPTWLLHMPSLISLQDRVGLRDEVFGTTRERMLREITSAFEALSAESPILLVLEDLHWSDPSTIDLLASIATRVSPAQLMILATYRPAGLGGSGHPLSRIQHELEIHGQCRLLPLSYLTEDDIRDYVAWRLPEVDFHAGQIGSLHRRTNGNPLFVTCIVDELVRSGSVHFDSETVREIVPNTLQNMFERQFDQLTESEREIVDTAAAEGESFSTASIALALARDPAEVEASCEGLVKRQVILKRADSIRFPDGAESPRYSFLHVLCRDAAYRRLRPSRLSRLHGSLGNSTEVLYASDLARVAAELAGHFELAGNFPKAISYLRMAAEGAGERFASKEATRHLERAIHLIERVGDAGNAALHMDLLEQRALVRMSAMDPEGAIADLAAVDAQARLARDTNRRVKALIDSVTPWGFLNFRKCLDAIEEARQMKSDAEPVLAALVDAYRGGVNTYFFGWTREREEFLNASLPTLNSVSDPRVRCRFLWMEAFVRNGASDYAGGSRAGRESRECARKAGSFHQYFVATHTLIAALVQSGNLGEAMRLARETAAMAATNHHLLERFWLEAKQAFVMIESFDFAGARPICERIGCEPMMIRYNLTPHVLLWLGLARLGTGAFDGASEALDRLDTIVEAGGVGFEYRFPLLQGQAQCALMRGDRARAEALINSSIRLAQEYRAPGYAAKGYRQLAEIASQEGRYDAAAEYVSAAVSSLNDAEVLNVEWQVYATASRVFGTLGRTQESEHACARAVRAADLVAATLADEPDLQRSILLHLERELSLRASA